MLQRLLLCLTPLLVAADSPRSAVEAWDYCCQLLEASASACGAEVRGAYTSEGARGPAPREPAVAPPRPAEGGTLEVRRFDASPVQPDRFDVQLQLALRAEDTVDATLLLEDVLARLAAQPEIVRTPSRPTTWPLPGGKGLMVAPLRLRLDLGDRPAPERAIEGGHHSLEHAARALAREAVSRVPGLRFAPGEWEEGRRLVSLQPVDGELPRAAALHHFLHRLETTAPGRVVDGLGLKVRDQEDLSPPDDAWAWWGRLVEHRDGAAADRPPISALAGLHLWLDVLSAFEREGVDLDGFVPETLYGNRPRRELGLSEEQLRALGAEAGYRLEVRRMHLRPADPGLLSLAVALRFEHPRGSVEGTRLYEHLRRALLAQPEVLEVSREDTAVRKGVVQVGGLRLLLRPRPVEPVDAPPRSGGVQTYLRAIAARDGIGLGELSIRTRPDGCRVAPESGTDRPQAVYDFLFSVESEQAGHLLTGLELQRDRHGGWAWEVDVRCPGE